MTKIKICGLKCENDIHYVNTLIPDYVGFVFAKSKRQVDPFTARNLVGQLNKNIKKVGVFLNHSIDMVRDIAEFCELDVIQLHGDESSDFCNLIHQEVWKAFRVKTRENLKDLYRYNTDGLLLDTYVKGAYGGTGETFDWEMVSKISREKFIILAGGLTDENIKKAIKIVRPQVVDVSSSVETNGYKDFEKMKKFLERVKKNNGE